MFPSKIIHQTVMVTREIVQDTVSLLSEAVLGRPIKAQAVTCWVNLSEPCSLCGSCGADKRRYWLYCYECDTCVSGCAWCLKPSCVCDYC
jgi:hypothetical protein